MLTTTIQTTSATKASPSAGGDDEDADDECQPAEPARQAGAAQNRQAAGDSEDAKAGGAGQDDVVAKHVDRLGGSRRQRAVAVGEGVAETSICRLADEFDNCPGECEAAQQVEARRCPKEGA